VEQESRALERWQADTADHVGKAGRAVPVGIEGLLGKAGMCHWYRDWPWEWLPVFKLA
jgi:hypothetical protein